MASLKPRRSLTKQIDLQRRRWQILLYVGIAIGPHMRNSMLGLLTRTAFTGLLGSRALAEVVSGKRWGAIRSPCSARLPLPPKMRSNGPKAALDFPPFIKRIFGSRSWGRTACRF